MLRHMTGSRRVPFRCSALLAAVALSCAIPLASAAQPPRAWIASWTASPMSGASPAGSPRAWQLPVAVIDGQTIRQRLTLSLGGAALRVCFSNAFGATPLRIGAASIGYRNPTTGRTVRLPLTFGGERGATVAAGSPVLSDPVSLAVPDGATLDVSAFFPGKTPVTTLHQQALQRVRISSKGDFVLARELPGAKPFTVMVDPIHHYTAEARPFLSEVDVLSGRNAAVIVALGDSITDGFHSTPGADDRWPDFLARRIRRAGLHLAVANEGISGNRVLADGAGPSALSRFDRDVLAIPGARTIILLEGINDIGFSGGLIPGLSPKGVLSARRLIWGYRQLIARAHEHGLRILLGTMTPFQGSPAYSEAKERVRLAVNRWIRENRQADGVIDFDAAMRDPNDPSRLRPALDSGDHIHPNDRGYATMARAVNLKLLQ